MSVDARSARRAWHDAERSVFWLDRPDAPSACPPLEGSAQADLAIVGGGFTGLWAALQAKEDDPDREVTLLEAETVAFGGSGRNGGFCMRTLTHGIPNGLRRFPRELVAIEAEAASSFEGLRDTVRRHAIECDWTESGEMAVAREPHEVAWAHEEVEQLRTFGYDAVVLDRDEVRAEVDSPTYLAGAWDRSGCVMVDPARLAWGLRRAALELGVRIRERTPVTALARDGAALRLATPGGVLRAPRVVVGTNAFPPLLPEIRRYVVPVYDHVLVTEPLSAAQWDAVGWERRQGLADMANRFHYYRRTADGRILWGGYDAVYHWRGRVDPAFEDRPRTFDALSAHFFQTFPQLEGLRFTHRWAGVIDTCSRFSVFFGRAFDGALAYAAGYTGMGVGATRFGARVALDLVDGLDTPRTRLALARTKPVPFPPEPLRSAGIAITVRALARADRRQGRRGPWLRLLDAAGLGFDS
ncbi:MAG: NAD(P)/FAD-dependent oxidoreductase [Planctomycetaceae bacterium]